MLKRKIIMLILLFLLTMLCTNSYGTQYYVDPNGDDDANGLSWATAFATIQKGIDEANDWDFIDVNEGTYYENIDFDGVACTVRSTDPNDWDVINATIIDGNDNGSVVTFDSSEDSNSILSGFMITGGSATNGGGIYCYDVEPTINRCVIVDNNATSCGGGIYSYYGSCQTVQNCVIIDNAGAFGGGIYNGGGSSPTIANCVLYGNAASQDGGGVYDVGYTSPVITNCTLSKNTAGDDGGGLFCGYSSYPDVTNCILWANSAVGDGNEIYESAGSATVSYSDIEGGWSGTGNIDSYPYFEDFNNDDFHLTWNSPCINKGDPNGDYTGQTDIDGESRVIEERVDMGADEFNPEYPNLVQNSGFEDGVDANGVPLYWVDEWASTSKSLDSNEKHSGDYSWKFVSENPGLTSGALSDCIAVDVGQLFKLSVWIKCEEEDERIYVGWQQCDANSNYIDHKYFVLYNDTISTDWTKFDAYRSVKSKYGEVEYVKVRFLGPYGSTGTVWWDDFSLTEEIKYLTPYGQGNESDVVATIDFGSAYDDDPNYNGGITWTGSAMGERCTDSEDNNITYRELEEDETLDISFPAFNLPPGYDANDPNDPNSLPLTPMLLEIMYKDTVCVDQNEHRSYYQVFVSSKIDYINLDPNYLKDTERYYKLAHFGGINDEEWKHLQYGFQKSNFQLLRAIDGQFTIRIENDADANMPIDYVSLRKISESECEELYEKKKDVWQFYEVEMPANNPISTSYDDPNIVVFSRDIMRPVYKHTKPLEEEIIDDSNGAVTGFSCWSEIEPLSFSIYSENGINVTDVTVSNLEYVGDANDFIDGNDISIYHVVYDETRLHYISKPTPYALNPDRIEGFDGLQIDPNTSERIWLKVRVPGADENLPAGLYEGNATIHISGCSDIAVPIEFDVYDITLDLPAQINPVYRDPYWAVFSSDADETFKAYEEAGFDPFIYADAYRITAGQDPNDSNEPPIDPNTIVFDSNLFEEFLDKSIDEGYAKDICFVQIMPSLAVKELYELVMDSSAWGKPGDINAYSKLSEPNFVKAFGSLVKKYKEVGEDAGRNITFAFTVTDEPGVSSYKRILADRLFTIIRDNNCLTTVTYYTSCDETLYVDPCDYTLPPELDCNLPALTDLVDYKIWAMSYAGKGYKRHNDANNPYHPNIDDYYGYYTTGHSQYRNPVYNRFLHGFFAFGTDSDAVSAYAMGDYIADPYDDMDAGYSHIFTFSYPDFLFAYPTWSGELLYTIGGLEAIREGVKDTKYTTTLENLIDDNPNGDMEKAAQSYLDEITGRIDPNYNLSYSNQSTDYGYYAAILEGLSDTGDDDDFEVFTRVRQGVAEYITLVETGDSYAFCIRDSENYNTATFYDSGNLVLAGTLDVNSTPTATANDEFRVQNSGGTDVAIIDTTSGNMVIAGSLYENQGTLSPSGDDFIIKDSSGNVIAYIDEDGNIYLKGSLYENM